MGAAIALWAINNHTISLDSFCAHNILRSSNAQFRLDSTCDEAYAFVLKYLFHWR